MYSRGESEADWIQVHSEQPQVQCEVPGQVGGEGHEDSVGNHSGIPDGALQGEQ